MRTINRVHKPLTVYKLSHRSRVRLRGVHPDLIRVVELAIEESDVDFCVLEGVRTIERQRYLKSIGASRIMKSRHLTGHAVDLGAWSQEERKVLWDWPLYHRIAKAMKRGAKIAAVPIEWGGDWSSFADGPHFQLPRKEYT